jgi:hypothetical protein
MEIFSGWGVGGTKNFSPLQSQVTLVSGWSQNDYKVHVIIVEALFTLQEYFRLSLHFMFV